jgi:hypothetical protein
LVLIKQQVASISKGDAVHSARLQGVVVYVHNMLAAAKSCPYIRLVVDCCVLLLLPPQEKKEGEEEGKIEEVDEEADKKEKKKKTVRGEGVRWGGGQGGPARHYGAVQDQMWA